jgi:hypothetical protein
VARPELKALPIVWSEIALVAVIALFIVGGCDWFNDPVQVSFSPETSIVSYPTGLVPPGSDVTIAWSGSDRDGQVVRFEWTLDDTLAGTTGETSMTLLDVEEGTHRLTVAAVDNDGNVDETPAECTFVASLGSLVPRVVLAELLTTKICPNCWKADLALERMLSEFGEANLTVVSYHYDPPPDVLATEETVARCDWYYVFFPTLPTQFPVVIFDGLEYDVGAADTTSTKIVYRTLIEERQMVGSPVSIELEGALESGRGNVTATVRVHDWLLDGSRTVRMMIIEDRIWDGSHFANFVVRDILDEQPLSVSAPGESLVVAREFTLGDWDPQHLDLIALVQDETTAEVMQSARLSTQR